MKLSNQAVGALLMTLQKCLADQSDITELLGGWELEIKDEEIYVLNPPAVEAQNKPEKPVFDIS